ncbi:MAG TPA: TonB-dependent receptor [Blastocatellia bacterium]|nr:TonB-dependent receptor [Blastocatellia bacterium]
MNYHQRIQYVVTRFLTAVLCVFCLSLAAGAQESRGTITGRIADAAGAILPGVKVDILNTATNVTVTATTNDEGRFSAPFLLPGAYKVTAEKTGFKRFVQSGVEVRVAETVELNLTLQPGEVSEIVEISAATPLLDTAGSSVGQIIDERRVQELPLFAGNPMELTLIATGIVNATDMRLRKAGFNNAPSQFSSDGNGQFNNDFTIDGIPNNFPVGNGQSRVAFSPPVYSVKEFKIQTSSYDATVGRTIGALTNVNTASGANGLHGELHWWERNSFLDAANFFNNKNNTKRTPYGDHRYGASAGGPIWLPKLYNGSDRSFWYFAWESNRWSDSGSLTATVPTAKQRQGDFSDLLKLPNGSTYQLFNPFTTRPAATAGRFQRDPFPNNIIPTNLLNPVALKILNFYPLPNQAGTAEGRNNDFQAYKILESYDVFMARVDHAFSEKHRMFARVHYDTWTERKGLTGNTFFSKEINGIQLNRNNAGLALDDVYSFSPTFVMNVRYGITYQKFPEKRFSQGTDLTALGFSSNLVNQLVDKSAAVVPRIQLGGFATLSPWESGDGTNTGLIHSFANTNTWLVGKHNMRFGADVRFYRSFGNRFPTDIAPDFNFGTSASFLRGPLDNAAAAPLGQDLGAFLLGIPAGSMSRSASFAAQDKFYGFFLQDDYKLAPKFTLNLGLRYELETPITERYNRLVAGFAFGQSNPLEAAAQANYARNPIPELPAANFRVLGGLQFVNQDGNGRSPFKGEKNNFLPRIGLAWQPLEKLVVRGGYGIFYDTLGVNTTAPIQTGFSISTPIQASLDNGQTYVATFANPFPNGLIQPLGAGAGLLTNIGQNVAFFDPKMKQAYAQRWSLGFQYELPWGFVLDSAYVANRGTRLAVSRNYNATPNRYLSTLATRDQTTINFLSQQFPSPFRGLNPVFGNNISREQLLRPFPAFGSVSVEEPIGYSWYHSMQNKIEKRFAKGVTFQLAYTWSKQMDATEFLNPGDALPYETISAGDRTHRVAGSGIIELPFGNGRKFASNLPRWADTIIGGWQIAYIFQRQSGPPIGFGNVIFTGDIKNIALAKEQRDVDRWFNTDAGFNKNAAQQLASNLRTFPLRFNGLRGDDQQRWDFSLSKKFIITERINASLRGEAFNAFNHVNFSTPNTNPTDTNFGRITGTQSAARSWQFALKIVY